MAASAAWTKGSIWMGRSLRARRFMRFDFLSRFTLLDLSKCSRKIILLYLV